jgi:H+/Cl- antiporter ClcA
MKSLKLRAIRFIPLLLLALILVPLSVHAQDVTMEELDDWFYSRIAWWAVIGVFLGVVASLFHLCRLEFKVRSSKDSDLSVDGQARRKFGIWLLCIFFAAAILLFLDAWLLYEFDEISLSGWDALGRVWANYRTLVIEIITLTTFALTVALVTRFKSDCRCRYAFIRGPQGK